jgi:SAM-dependent methyltransferase
MQSFFKDTPMTVPQDWYQSFFSGFMVDIWLQATTDEQTCTETDFIQQMLQVPAPARILDVPCGGGRHSFALAERGYALTAVDISPAFLDAARTRAAGRPETIRWEQRDMRELPWPEEFDGAFTFGNSFGYLDDAGNARFLQAVSCALKPGARYVMDIGYLAETLLPNLQERYWAPVGDGLLLWDRRYDHEQGRLEVEYTGIQDSKVTKHPMSARLYTFREVSRLLEEAGFTNLKSFGSLTQEPFKFGSKRLLMVATKK